MEGEQQLHKKHLTRRGKTAQQRKKKQKQRKDGSSNSASGASHNPKAFTFSGGVVSVQRRVQRTLDKLSLKAKEEKIDKTPDIPPPYIVVVHGPPNVGKTTLIRSLVRHYTRHALQVVRGPITVVASQQRRLTFIECSGTDLHQMLDAAKIADLVLLLIDASFGFEMETFEFINILQTHGFPRVIGVLTRLDRVGAQPAKERLSLPAGCSSNSSSSSNSCSSNSNSSNSSNSSSSNSSTSSRSSSSADHLVGTSTSRRKMSSSSSSSRSSAARREEEEGDGVPAAAAGKRGTPQHVRRRKKELKKRFWTEIYEGAKLFYLTGLQFEGRYYKKREVLNLSRYIAVQRFPTLTWRSAHPYLLSLRCEPLAPLLPAGAASPFRTDSSSTPGLRVAAAADRTTEEAASQTAACAFYGYVRGAVLRQGQWLHIPGAGDFQIKGISCCDDPCPPPTAAKRLQELSSTTAKPAAVAEGGEEERSKEISLTRRSRRMRSLKDQQRAIYAPAADVGSVRVDADAMYIHLPDSKVSFTRSELLLREGEEKQQHVSEQPFKEEQLQQDEVESSSFPSESRRCEKRRSSKKTLTSGSTCSSETGGEETEDPEEEGETADGDAADLGAGDRDLIVGGAAAKEKRRKEEDIGDAVKMVRELQEAQQILHVRQQEQQLRLLPTSACVLGAAPAAASTAASSLIRQLSAASDTEGEEDMWEDEEEEEERMILEQQQQEGSGGDVSAKSRRAAPPASREAAAAAADSDEEESEEATAESASEEEELTEEEEAENQAAVEAIHAAARQRFERPPTLQDILYSVDPRMNGQQQQSSNSCGRRPAAESPHGDGSKGIVAKFLGDRTLPLFEEEEEEELHFSASLGSSKAIPGNGLYGALPAVQPLLLQRDAVSSPKETGRVSRGEDKALAIAASSNAAAAAGVEEEEADTAVVSDDVLYAALGCELAREKHLQRDYWSPEKMEELKAYYFITGGWSSAEEEEEEKKSGRSSSSKEKAVAVDGSDGQQEEEKQIQQKAAETQRQLLEARELQQQEQQLQGAGGGVSSSTASQLQFAACACIGSFVRVYIEHLPLRWLQHLSAERLVLLGGLSAGETGQSFLKLRAKKHRWYPRVLKSDDVLLFSAGWRRFQSLPLFALEDRSEARLRYLKYTPEHLHCLCCTWGPVLPAATPFVAIRFTHATAHYRICLSGLLLESSPSLLLKKKLKLLGEPSKIYKNTAFIAQMFNSDLEVNMCLGAKIQTVSGIRGQIKKAHGSHGVFRAAFEDKILISDLVVCKSWLSLQPRQFYNAVLDIPEWIRLRTLVEIRQALQLPVPSRSAAAPDSTRQQKQRFASPAEEGEESTQQAGGRGSGGVGALQNQRRTTIFSPIKIPKQLMLKLPFHTRTKLQLRTSRLKKLKGKDKEEEEEIRKPLVNAYDRRVAALLQRLQTIRNARLEKKKEKQQQKLEKKAAAAAKQAAEKSRKQLEIRRKRYVKQGKMETAMRKKMRFTSSC